MKLPVTETFVPHDARDHDNSDQRAMVELFIQWTTVNVFACSGLGKSKTGLLSIFLVYILLCLMAFLMVSDCRTCLFITHLNLFSRIEDA